MGVKPTGWRAQARQSLRRRQHQRKRQRRALERKAAETGMTMEEVNKHADVLGRLEPVVTGLIHEGDTCIVAGREEVGKSILLHHLAGAVSLGRDYLGWRIPKARRVMYIDAENNMTRMRDQWQRDQVQAAAADVIWLPKNPRLTMATKDGVNRIGEIITKGKPDVVVLDTAAKMVTKANNADSVTAFYAHLDTFRKAANHSDMVFILVMHFKKNADETALASKYVRNQLEKNNDVIKHMIAGSAQWVAQARTVITLRRWMDKGGVPVTDRFLLVGSGNDIDLQTFRLKRTPKPPFQYSHVNPVEAMRLELPPGERKHFEELLKHDSFTYKSMEEDFGVNRKITKRLIDAGKRFGIVRPDYQQKRYLVVTSAQTV